MAAKSKPAKGALNATNLQALGAERLAELLIEFSIGNATAKRRLRLELAGAQSPAEVAGAVRKRLSAIARSRSFIDWRGRKELIDDLETQRRAIVVQLAKSHAGGAMDLMWRFPELANPIFERCEDGSGTVMGVFHAACVDLGSIAKAVKPDSETLADRVFKAFNENDYGQYDNLIALLAPSLGKKGLDRLKALFTNLAKYSPPKPRPKDRQVIGWASSGPIYAEDSAARRSDTIARTALRDIADAQGDVDAFIAQYGGDARAAPSAAAEIARRLLAVGRAEDAWAAISTVDEKRPRLIPIEWEQAKVEVLDALGRTAEAQAFRWNCFERSLSKAHLQDYLKRLPDFEDVDAEDRAMSQALGHPNALAALDFLINWPAVDKAAVVVFQRAAELSGDLYEVLTPAAEALASRRPLAATIVLLGRWCRDGDSDRKMKRRRSTLCAKSDGDSRRPRL